MTDFAARLPLELGVAGRLRSTVPGRFWFCTIATPVVCTLAEGVERDHIHDDLLSDDRTKLTVSALVLTPAAANRVLQPGICDFAVHVAAVLDLDIGTSGEMDPDQPVADLRGVGKMLFLMVPLPAFARGTRAEGIGWAVLTVMRGVHASSAFVTICADFGVRVLSWYWRHSGHRQPARQLRSQPWVIVSSRPCISAWSSF